MHAETDHSRRASLRGRHSAIHRAVGCLEQLGSHRRIGFDHARDGPGIADVVLDRPPDAQCEIGQTWQYRLVALEVTIDLEAQPRLGLTPLGVVLIFVGDHSLLHALAVAARGRQDDIGNAQAAYPAHGRHPEDPWPQVCHRRAHRIEVRFDLGGNAVGGLQRHLSLCQEISVTVIAAALDDECAFSGLDRLDSLRHRLELPREQVSEHRNPVQCFVVGNRHTHVSATRSGNLGPNVQSRRPGIPSILPVHDRPTATPIDTSEPAAGATLPTTAAAS